ncbi:hypothetical protein CPB84DRAFT_1882951 [Gymnopilus junonius]|uniref:Uncharacterized protein n=1 Tax=Gymnopilus junonius TaxID=109634 RepID=A0A9P5ND12_GYMJU|nr:hypothetical protein CPB84DRAFT_1882951 [Gymnopilus junonius]
MFIGTYVVEKPTADCTFEASRVPSAAHSAHDAAYNWALTPSTHEPSRTRLLSLVLLDLMVMNRRARETGSPTRNVWISAKGSSEDCCLCLDDWVTTGRRHRDAEARERWSEGRRRRGDAMRREGARLAPAVETAAYALDDWVMEGRRWRDSKAGGKSWVAIQRFRLFPVVKTTGCALEERGDGQEVLGLMELNVKTRLQHLSSFTNFTNHYHYYHYYYHYYHYHHHFTTPTAYTQAIPTMQLFVKALISAAIVLLACASLAILLRLYYYSPARRTRMEEEDLEGIELEAEGEGNIRRRAAAFQSIVGGRLARKMSGYL